MYEKRGEGERAVTLAGCVPYLEFDVIALNVDDLRPKFDSDGVCGVSHD